MLIPIFPNCEVRSVITGMQSIWLWTSACYDFESGFTRVCVGGDL